MRVRIGKSRASGTVLAPSSKSYAHRLLICAGLADGESRIGGININQDVLATADVLNALGAKVRFDGKTAYVKGCGGRIRGGAELPCRESGSTLRFMIPLSLLGGGGDFIGTERLISRGVGVYDELLGPRGATLTVTRNKISVRGTLSSGDYVIRGDVSSQFISGMMFALPLCGAESTLRVTEPFESRDYVAMTADVLSRAGINIESGDGNSFLIKSGAYGVLDAEVEGDWSNAAFLFALGALGGNVNVKGLREDSRQGDKICLEYLKMLDGKNAVLDMSNCPDLAPVMFAVAAAKNGGLFTGTRRLAIKESDRAAAMADELAKFGVTLNVGIDTVEVTGNGIHAPTDLLCGHNDHRIVMSLAVLATLTGGVIDGAEAVSKSFPDFFKVLSELGTEVEYLD